MLFCIALRLLRGGGKTYILALSCMIFCFRTVDAQNLPDANGQVSSIVADGAGGLFISGGFTTLTEKPSGVSVSRIGIAHILANGQVDRAWNPTFVDGYSFYPLTAKVHSLAMENGILYAAGSFSSVNGMPRNGLVALNSATGAPTSWNPNTNNFPNGGYGRESWNIAAMNNRIYAKGNANISNANVYTVGIINAGDASIQANAGFGNVQYFQAIAVANGIVYAGGFQTLQAFDAVTGAVMPSFDQYNQSPIAFSAGRVAALAVRGNTLFVGGFFLDDVIRRTTGALVYQNLAALDATTGKWLPWNISANGTVLSLSIQNNALYVGGVFTSVNSSPRTYAAALNPDIGTLLPFAPLITDDAMSAPAVYGFSVQNDVVVLGGVFATVDGRPSGNLSGTASASVVAPSEPVANISFVNPRSDGTGYTVQWTPPASAPAGYTVVAVEGASAPAGTPQNGEQYTGNPAFTATPTVPFSGQVVYDGSGTSADISGLIPNTNYTFIVYPYNASGIARTYGVASAAAATGRTNDITPPVVALHPGILTVSSATLSFGDVALGSTRTRRYTMYCTNLTTASVVITPPTGCEISVGGAAFSATPIVFTTRATIDQTDIRVRFSPSANGVLAGSITHIAGSTNALATVSGASSPPSITVSSLSLDFGAVTPSSTATRVYRVNYRNLVTRSITITPPVGFTVSTTGGAPFGTSAMPLTVQTAVSGRFNVYAQFAPTIVGKSTGTLQNDNPDIGTIALFVEGEGVYPTVALSASGLDFDGVPLGTCKTLSYRITPAGGVSWQQTQICPPASGNSNVQISTTGPNGPFTSGCRSVTFARVGGVRSAQVWVRYCPTTDADMNETITHITEPGGLTEHLSLSGFGARPDITVLNPTINFGTINLGASASAILRVRYGNVTQPGTITLSTTSTHPFAFDNSALGTSTSGAALTTSATATSATFSMRVTFTPTAAGLFRTTFAAVCVAANGTTTDTFTFTGRANGAAITANNNQTLNFNGNFLLTPNTRSFPLRYDNITTNTIEIQPTAHPALLLMDPQTGVFSTTAGITLTVGGTAANPVSSTATLWARFLPVRGGTTSATLTFISTPMGGSTSTSETLRLSGNGLAPFMSATTATNQGTLRFNAVPFGTMCYYLYTLSYRNITSGTITVNVPLGSAFDVTESSSGTWTTAGQTLTVSNIPATSATTSVSLWIRYNANNTVTTRSTFAHVSIGGDAITNISDNLVCIGTSLLPTVTVSPGTINFTPTGITKSSLASYQIDYQNITTQTIQLQAQSGFGFSTTATGPFTTVGALTIRTPGTDGSLPMWALFTASTTTQISATITHTALDARGSVIASDDLRCVGRGKPHLAVYERGDWGCTPISPLKNYTFNVKQPARAGDVRSEGKIIRIEHIGINQPIKIVASEGYVLSVAGERVSVGNYTYYDCILNHTVTISKPANVISTSAFVNHAVHSSTADISVAQAKYQVRFDDGNFLPQSTFEIWVTSVAPTSCNRAGTIMISSGTASTTLTVTTQCQPEQTLCVSDNKRLLPNDKLLLHTYTSSPLPLYPVIENRLNGRSGQWYICNPYNPVATIKVAEAWKIFDFQGSNKSMIGLQENYVWDKHPDFLDASGKSKVRHFDATTLSEYVATSGISHHATSVMSSAAAFGNNGIGIAGIDWNTYILSSGYDPQFDLNRNFKGPDYIRFPEYSSKVLRGTEQIDFRSSSHSYTTQTLGTDFHRLYKHDMVTVTSTDNEGEGGKTVANITPWAIIVGSGNINDEWGGTNFGEGIDIVTIGASEN